MQLQDESTPDEFGHVYNENREEFLHEILDNVNEVLESIQATNDNEDENVHSVVKSCAHSPAPTGNMSLFVGLNTYKKNFLKLRISCYVPMCKLKQEITIMSGEIL